MRSRQTLRRHRPRNSITPAPNPLPAALARLPEDRRRLVALAYLEGESRASLSMRFGVPVGTIKTWLHRTILVVRKDCLATMAAA